jgi:cytoskeletal protein CcmA (bactofilin family)
MPISAPAKLKSTVEAKRRAEIFPTGKVRGDIHTPVLTVTPGGLLDGRLQMTAEKPEETTVVAASVANQTTTPYERS